MYLCFVIWIVFFLWMIVLFYILSLFDCNMFFSFVVSNICNIYFYWYFKMADVNEAMETHLWSTSRLSCWSKAGTIKQTQSNLFLSFQVRMQALKCFSVLAYENTQVSMTLVNGECFSLLPCLVGYTQKDRSNFHIILAVKVSTGLIL